MEMLRTIPLLREQQVEHMLWRRWRGHFQLDIGHQFHLPPSTLLGTSTIVITSLMSTGTATAGISSTTAVSTGSNSGTPQAATTSAGTTSNSTNSGALASSTKIGLGVGVPLALGIIGAICFLALQMRKKRNTGAPVKGELPGDAPAQQQPLANFAPNQDQSRWNSRGSYKTPEPTNSSFSHNGSHNGSYDGRERYYERYPAELDAVRPRAEL